jgi:hypothetical protein
MTKTAQLKPDNNRLGEFNALKSIFYDAPPVLS